MRESIGSTFLYNIIFLFIIIVMFLLTATLNYYKGYKVNSYVLHSIEKYNGYNTKSQDDIDRILTGIGYSSENGGCSPRGGSFLLTNNNIHDYCVYYFPDDRSRLEKKEELTDGSGRPLYYSYGVTTFISIELPIVGKFKVPVFTKGERIYRFTGSCQINGDERC